LRLQPTAVTPASAPAAPSVTRSRARVATRGMYYTR
jgi:hypothetical protein